MTISLTVEDSGGAVLAGAIVKEPTGRLLGRTGPDGQLILQCAAPCRLHVEAEGFATRQVTLSAAATLRLDPAGSNEQVTVTAYRAPLGALESPVTTRVLTQTALFTTPAITLDGQLRQLPGVELFRRSSSLNANPSSQGMSLRGLGSTSASRTLLVEDDVPLNDPVGGWIHWEEQPELAVKSVEAVRGGASDLYGSSAIGGVVSLVTSRPADTMGEFRSSFGALGTYDESALGQTKHGPWGLLATGGVLGTDGFIQEAPWQRGPIDRRSGVHAQNVSVLAEHDRGPLRYFARFNGFNESRANGTPDQTNGTRLWRYSTGADWQGLGGSMLSARLYGSTEHFRQVFSSISNLPVLGSPACTYRCAEAPTRFSLTPDNEFGGSAHWNKPLGRGFLLVTGGDMRDVRVWDTEQTFGSTAALTNLSDHQRDTAGYAEAMWVHKAWTLTAAGRLDWFRNYDGRQWLFGTGKGWGLLPQLPTKGDQIPFDPRMGLSRRLGGHLALNASAFRAFRAPTPNELYRSTQVGNKLTNPNGTLNSERATGWETGVSSEWNWGILRTSYFLTQVNRPITAVTVNLHSSPILLQRENLGQIQSKGLSVDFQLRPQHWLSLDGGYQYARATVTRGSQDKGNWIPEVARNMATLDLRAYKPSLGLLNLQGRISGRQYDDDANLYMLHGFFRLDTYAARDIGKRFELFAAGENLLDRRIEVARTPTTTLAQPRTARAGILFRLGGTAK
ncbi:MAG: TonB-dependent receptor [Terracidiphilus sp.]